ncbi:MAG: hypothetical protein WD802_08780 [Gemmatimonadaceae bacterium]
MIGFCFAVAVFAADDLGAQASPYVPLDDIAYQYIDAIMARGEFRRLSALERPYTVGALLSAIDSARARETSARMTDYLDALEVVIAKYSVRPRSRVKPVRGDVVCDYLTRSCSSRRQGLWIDPVTIDSSGRVTQLPAPLRDSSERAADSIVVVEYINLPPDVSFRARGTVNLYATVQTSARRELMLASDANSIRPAGTIRVMMAGGPIAASIRPIIDTRLNTDIEFTGPRDRYLAGRTEDGYVSGQWKYGELFFGRAGRNWGPSTLHGLQLGNYAYTYDHLYGRIGTDKLHFATVVARLDDFQDAAGVRAQRYFSIHRLAVRHAAWEFAATESYLYSGAGRGFEPSLINPFNIYSLSWRNEAQDGNLGLGLEAAFRSRIGTLAAHAFIDDFQIDRCDPNCEEPSSYGLTLSADGLPIAGDQRWFASYARVSYLAYRTPNLHERYSAFNIGLGQGFSDFDEVRVGLDLALVPRTPLRLYLARRRQGEGDYRDPYPAPADYATTPSIFGGIVSHITRLGLTVASRLHDFELAGDVGVNRVSDDAEVRGVSANGFQGRIRLAWEPRFSVSF